MAKPNAVEVSNASLSHNAAMSCLVWTVNSPELISHWTGKCSPCLCATATCPGWLKIQLLTTYLLQLSISKHPNWIAQDVNKKSKIQVFAQILSKALLPNDTWSENPLVFVQRATNSFKQSNPFRRPMTVPLAVDICHAIIAIIIDVGRVLSVKHSGLFLLLIVCVCSNKK